MTRWICKRSQILIKMQSKTRSQSETLLTTSSDGAQLEAWSISETHEPRGDAPAVHYPKRHERARPISIPRSEPWRCYSPLPVIHDHERFTVMYTPTCSRQSTANAFFRHFLEAFGNSSISTIMRGHIFFLWGQQIYAETYRQRCDVLVGGNG